VGASLLDWYNYWVISLLMLVGVYGMMAKRNLLKKLMGMNVLQVGVILFWLTYSPKLGATIPVIDPTRGEAILPADYANPLPQALMLTAIVVSVATTGLALALLIRIHRRYGTLEEDQILERMR
jgi:multicomponent Na+:H+ antiporter subunit C